MNEKPTHLDLFSGSGAFTLAAESAGFQTVGFSETDAFCSALLAEKWPHVTNYGDLRNVPKLRVNLLTGGWPCQPFSVAGRRLGEADDRHLWPAMLGVIDRCEPDFILGENVVGIKSMVLSRCLDELEERGYQHATFDLPSCCSGLPSLERHIWVVAARDGAIVEGNPSPIIQGAAVSAIWNSDRAGDAGEFLRRCLSSPVLLRSRKGFPNFVDRIKCVGNAVPPPIAQIYCEAIYAQLK